jgi:alkylated DNA repair dioxygenase AlkB
MQRGLFGGSEVGVDASFERARRYALENGAWVEHVPEWLTGHEILYERLLREVDFTSHRRLMYERVVDVPRLLGDAPISGESADFLGKTSSRLASRYGVELPSITLAHYRDGRDSVAMHGDKMGSLVDDTIVATVSLGHPRRFLFRPVEGGTSGVFALGWGDLFVMGGSFQRTYVHGVPKVAKAGSRISIMFRPRIPERDAASEARARKARLGVTALPAALGSLYRRAHVHEGTGTRSARRGGRPGA